MRANKRDARFGHRLPLAYRPRLGPLYEKLAWGPPITKIPLDVWCRVELSHAGSHVVIRGSRHRLVTRGAALGWSTRSTWITPDVGLSGEEPRSPVELIGYTYP